MLPVGCRRPIDRDGDVMGFADLSDNAWFWGANEDVAIADNGDAYAVIKRFGFNWSDVFNGYAEKKVASSIRCIKD